MTLLMSNLSDYRHNNVLGVSRSRPLLSQFQMLYRYVGKLNRVTFEMSVEAPSIFAHLTGIVFHGHSAADCSPASTTG